MIVRPAGGPFVVVGLLSASVVVGSAVANGRNLWPQTTFVLLLLLLHYLYLSRRLLELRLDEIIYRTLFKTTRIRLGDLRSIEYEDLVTSTRPSVAMVLRLKGSNSPVVILRPRQFRKEDWSRFAGELERRSGLRFNVASPHEIPKPRPQPARPLDQLLALLVIGGAFFFYKVSDDYQYFEELPAIVFRVGGVSFLVGLLLLGAFRARLASLGWQTGSVVAWLGLVGAAALVAMLSVGLMKFANGFLDNAPPRYERFIVVKRSRIDGYMLKVRADATTNIEPGDYEVKVSWDDWDSSAKEDVVLVDVRPGFLHLPWVAGYRTCGDSKCM